MIKKYGFLTVSLMAIMAVTSARADIASTTYVNNKVDPVETKIDNHIADTTMHVTTAEKTAWNAKEDAANKLLSNVARDQEMLQSDTLYPSVATTQDMITTVTGGLVTGVASKQNKSTANYQMGNSSGGWTTMTPAQQNALNSGATAAKVDGYDAHVANDDIHVTAAQKNAWTAKQDAISDLGTIRSGAAAGATAVQPAAISDMETQTHAAATYQAKALVTNFTDADDTHYPSAKAVDTAIKAATSAASSGAADALQDAKDYANGKFQVKSTGPSIGGTDGAWTALTDGQLAAMNSGVKAADVTQITTNKNDIAKLNGNASTAGSVAKSIADAITDLDLANTYQAKGNYATAAQGTKADNALPAATYNSQVGTVNATNMGTTATTVVGAIKELKTAITTAGTTASNTYQIKSTKDYMIGNKDGGWTEMTTDQQGALNSGITSGKVSTYDSVASAVNNATTGLAATRTQANKGVTDAAAAQATANAALPAATYNSQVGTVSAANMGTTATTVVGAIKEVHDSVAGLNGTYATDSELSSGLATKQDKSDSTVAAKGNYIAAGSDVKGNLVALDTQLKSTDTTATTAAATANAAIPKPQGTCTDCVLHFNGTQYTWEEVGR